MGLFDRFSRKNIIVKKAFLWTCVFSVALLLIICACNLLVVSNASSRTYDSTETIPHNDVGILLATYPITLRGARNRYFDNLIKAAAKLYKAGKIDIIIVIGDNIRFQIKTQPRRLHN